MTNPTYGEREIMTRIQENHQAQKVSLMMMQAVIWVLIACLVCVAADYLERFSYGWFVLNVLGIYGITRAIMLIVISLTPKEN
jgi:hypothetical protein